MFACKLTCVLLTKIAQAHVSVSLSSPLDPTHPPLHQQVDICPEEMSNNVQSQVMLVGHIKAVVQQVRTLIVICVVCLAI